MPKASPRDSSNPILVAAEGLIDRISRDLIEALEPAIRGEVERIVKGVVAAQLQQTARVLESDLQEQDMSYSQQDGQGQSIAELILKEVGEHPDQWRRYDLVAHIEGKYLHKRDSIQRALSRLLSGTVKDLGSGKIEKYPQLVVDTEYRLALNPHYSPKPSPSHSRKK